MQTPSGVPIVVEQELVAHIFAPFDGPHADGAYQAIQQVWSRCAEHLHTTEPIALPTPAPASLIAVHQSPDSAFQVILSLEHDVLCLSVALASARSAESEFGQARRALTTWQRLDQLLDTVIGESTDLFLGLARLYLGKYSQADLAQDSDWLGPELEPLLPATAQRARWWSHAPSTIGGLHAWELAPQEDARSARRILLLGALGDDAELSMWAWSDGSALLPPFGRYLKHIAKIRYELRVYADGTSVAELCRLVDDGVRSVQGLFDAAPGADGPSAGDRQRSMIERLAALRADRARLAVRTALLKSMLRTVTIATSNATAALGAAASDGSGLLGDDEALATWFERQLGDDVSYLESSYESATRMAELVGQISVHPRSSAAASAPVLGIVTAMPEEFVAMSLMIDDRTRENVPGDRANYVVGTLPSLAPEEQHHVVLTLLGDTGNDSAADACANLARSFGTVGQVLMVGIAAGIPNLQRPEKHVRLGDIVVSTWGIVDYDHVVETLAGRELRQPFPPPSRLLAQHANWLAAEEMYGRRPWEEWLDRAALAGLDEFARPPESADLLYPDDQAEHPVPHPPIESSGHRPGFPKVHYGRVGSADRSLRSGRARDELAARHGLCALEMEGKGIGDAGFASGLEWLVIRGISDYGDSHTDGRWRKYASLVAAAYTRALLAVCPPFAPRGGHTGAARGQVH